MAMKRKIRPTRLSRTFAVFMDTNDNDIDNCLGYSESERPSKSIHVVVGKIVTAVLPCLNFLFSTLYIVAYGWAR